MADEDINKPETVSPAPAEIELTINGHVHRLAYEQAFVLGFTLLEKGSAEDASKVFSRLEAFTDRGPRAFIMHAFCECAARNYEGSKASLDAVFDGEQGEIAAALQDAFVSCHVGIRKEGLATIASLIDEHRNLPSLCLLLGNLLKSGNNHELAQRCWSLAVQRDRPNGAVAAAAMRHMRKPESE